MSTLVSNRIGLCLSGGGIRAAAFHAGVLSWLAETNRLEQVAHISTVSGGSLFTGLMMHLSDYKWPTSSTYLQTLIHQIKSTLLSSNLQKDGIKKFRHPKNWKYVNHRANIISQCIQERWGINKPLSALPEFPAWSINGTTSENGKRFRFKNGTGGDYSYGFADMKNLPICDAMAMSAAFPGLIGPLKIISKDYQWKKADVLKDIPLKDSIVPSHEVIHLYDGGVYDNLGLEALFDIGSQRLKERDPLINYIIVSDAGAPLKNHTILNPLNPRRFERLFNIMLDQTRSLRIRSFVNFIKNNKGVGSYFQIGAHAQQKIMQYCLNETLKSELLCYNWLTDNEVKQAAVYPTNLSSLTENLWQLLHRHGYETAKWNELIFDIVRLEN